MTRVLLVVLALAGISRAEALEPFDVSKTAAGFTLSYMKLAANGRAERWTLDLQPNGHLVFRGNHLPDSAAGCADRGGHFEIAAMGPNHLPLALLAMEAANEQAPLEHLPQNAPDKTGHFSFRLETELDEKFGGSRIVAPDAPKTAKFLSEVKRFYPALFKSAFLAAEVTVAKFEASHSATIRFKSIGALPINVLFPENAREAFFLQDGSKIINLSYQDHPASMKAVLRPSDSVTIRLALPPGEVPAGALLVYDNIAIVHHEGQKVRPTALRLCAALR